MYTARVEQRLASLRWGVAGALETFLKLNIYLGLLLTKKNIDSRSLLKNNIHDSFCA